MIYKRVAESAESSSFVMGSILAAILGRNIMTTLLQRIIVSLAKKLDSSAVGKVPPPNPIDASIGQKCEAIEATAFSKLTPLRWILEDGAYVLAVKSRRDAAHQAG